MSHIVVATWNVHSGVDGWGRPFDVVDGCRTLDADVIFLQETWCYDGEISVAQRVADELGYRMSEVQVARGTMLPPPENSSRRWGPALWMGSFYGPRVDVRALRPRRTFRSDKEVAATWRRGTIGLAALTRLEPVADCRWDLGQLRTDPARRWVLGFEFRMPTGEGASEARVLVAGTHMSHVSQGSIRHIGRIRREVSPRAEAVDAAVLVGDMNLPASVINLAFPGWRSVVRARTWPSWRPLAQPDHVLVRGAVSGSGEITWIAGSDHLPLKAVVTFG